MTQSIDTIKSGLARAKNATRYESLGQEKARSNRVLNDVWRNRMYKSFQRSTQASQFTDYSYDDATIAWIDILNVRNKKHAEITNVMRRVLDLAAEATSTGPIFDDGVYVGTPNSAVQYAIVGDTVIMVEKYQPETRAAAKLALFYRASLFSKMLFAADLLHRGVIVDGPVDCFQKDHNTIVTGAGVIMAYAIESKINCSGLFIHDSCTLLKNAARLAQINKRDCVVPFPIAGFDNTSIAPSTSFVIFERTEGKKVWDQALQKAPPHEKVTNSQMLVAGL